MASQLRARLNALSSTLGTPSAAEKKPARRGLISRVSSQPVDERLYALSGTALRRIGWSGRRFDVERCLFLDTETTGLSHGAGTVAFLVGVGYVRGGVLTIEQHMLSDYADEPELLLTIARLMQGAGFVCTFNGRTFDMPLLDTRFTLNRLRDQWVELEDLDLLPPARRAWKLRLGSCRLTNLEARELGLVREGDVPGSEAPQRFFDYLKTGDIGPLEEIIDHNRQDIASLASLLIRLCEVYADPQGQADRLDLFSLGKALEKQGESAEARELYRLSARPASLESIRDLRQGGVAEEANWRLFLLSRRNGDYEAARAVLETMIARRQRGDVPYEELAKLYEHRFKDERRALEYAVKARELCTDAEREAAHARRVARLRVKLERAKKNKGEGNKWPR